MPSVLECLDLRVGALARRSLEQHVVIGLAVERRVEIDQVDALVRDLAAQYVEVVAVIKCVRHPWLPGLFRSIITLSLRAQRRNLPPRAEADHRDAGGLGIATHGFATK